VSASRPTASEMAKRRPCGAISGLLSSPLVSLAFVLVAGRLPLAHAQCGWRCSAGDTLSGSTCVDVYGKSQRAGNSEKASFQRAVVSHTPLFSFSFVFQLLLSDLGGIALQDGMAPMAQTIALRINALAALLARTPPASGGASPAVSSAVPLVYIVGRSGECATRVYRLMVDPVVTGEC
jgi:hypothetical protein